MKMKISEHITPIDGNTMTRVKRAWLPKEINGVRIWLEQYEELYVYKIESVPAIIQGESVIFKVGKWIKVTERLIKWEIAG